MTASGKNGFHFMEWALIPIRWWLVTPTTFKPLLCQRNQIDHEVCSKVDAYSSSLIACKVVSSTTNTSQQELRLYTSTSYNSLHSLSCEGALFRIRDLICGEQQMALILAWVVWGFHGAPLANNSLRCNPFLVQRFDLTARYYPIGTLSFPFCSDAI